MAPSYISTRELICGSDLSIVVETVTKFVFSTSDKQVINSKHGVTLSFGASPRATINLIKAAKARAFTEKRGYVTPEDIRFIGKDVLRHRVILTYEAEADLLL